MCPFCGLQNLELMSWIPPELKIEHANNQKPISTPPTTEQMRTYCQKAANDCNFKLDNLVVEDNYEDGVMETLQPEDNFHNVTIRFNPKRLTRFTQQELMALARHEIMHPVTMGEKSCILIQNGAPEYVELQFRFSEAYDEMINYKMYVQVFPNDPHLRSYKDKEFTNYAIIFLSVKHMIQQNRLPNPLHPHINNLAIYQDAVYFFYENKNKLKEWVKKYQGQAIWKFWNWIHEDFNLIHDNVKSRDEMRDLIPIVIQMTLNVNPEPIFSSNMISFTENAYERILSYKNNIKNQTGKKIVESWERRFNEQPYIFN